MVLLPSSSNVGKEKTKTIHVNKRWGGGNKTKPNQAFIIKEMALSLYSVNQDKKNEMYLGFPNNKYACSVKNSNNNTEISDMPFKLHILSFENSPETSQSETQLVFTLPHDGCLMVSSRHPTLKYPRPYCAAGVYSFYCSQA